MGARRPGLVRAGFRRAGSSGGGGSGVTTIVAGPGIGVDGSTPAAPVVSYVGLDLDDTIKRRAAALTGLSAFSYWSDSFMQTAGRPGSQWTDINSNDLHPVRTLPGGVTQAAASSGFGGAVVQPSGYPFSLDVNTPSFFGPVVGGAAAFYLFVRFQLASDPGTGGPGGWAPGCSVIMGGVDGHSLAVMGLGVSSARSSSGFFGAVGGDVNGASNTTGLDSLLARDFDTWHDGELYRVGGHIFMRYDDGAPINIDALYPSGPVNITPLIQALTTVVLQPAVNVDHIAFAAAPNKTLSPVPS